MNLDQAANPIPNVKFKDIETCFFNSNSSHELGHKAKTVIEQTKTIIKKRFPSFKYIEFVPGGGTVANVRSITGAISFKPKRINKETYLDKVIISGIEHKSINDTLVKKLLNQYAKAKDSKQVVEIHKNRLALVSIMNVNNEIGTIQPIHEIYNIIKTINKETIFHSDICQGVSNMYLQTQNLPDIVSFSMYKLGGPHLGLVLSNVKLNEDYLGTPDTVSIQLSGLILEDYLEHALNHDTINKIREIKFKIKKEISQISKTSDIEIKDLSNDQYTVNHIQSFLLPKGYQAQLIQSILKNKKI